MKFQWHNKEMICKAWKHWYYILFNSIRWSLRHWSVLLKMVWSVFNFEISLLKNS
jgi:hypothetical protein